MTGLPLDLTPWLNATVATFDDERPRGVLNAWGNSFPAEELPFGSTLLAGGLAFALPAKVPGRPDSIEPLGQTISVPDTFETAGVALLCCGEMGDQRVPVHVLSADGTVIAELVALAHGVMIPAGTSPGDEGFACSHLHYAGDYDLALALPALWVFRHSWIQPSPVACIKLGFNPLFHLLAITLLERL